ncbi:probable E3 ubiquitin-protein ligase ZFP1 [Glycine soja]|uniref:RING-type E3 ubiquitin transferase n=1 Tax=Glycine soja TaxID=3848 RepID=A0A445KDA3_GLYSO|nr:probable E3 ubiquitin-protein ligase ZFP1 [Glycine soja]RZC08812.1 putative E3 ubiquitin-protein ligase ZFP1 [Glycine soja]
MDQMSQQVYFHSESIHFSGTNICLASGNGISLDCHYVLDAHDSYLDQHFQPYVQGHALAWHLSLPVPYVQAFIANGSSSENGRIGPQRYHDTTSSRGGHRFPQRYHDTTGSRSGHRFPQRYHDTTGSRSGHRFPQRYHDSTGSRSGHRFPHPPPQYHSFHHQVLPAQVIRGHSFNIHPPVTAPSYRVPTNPSHGSSILIHDAFEMGARHPGFAPFAGARIRQSHRGNLQEMITLINLPPAVFFPDDDVALLVDHHTDMHLDTEDMSYEDLLELGEQIGNAKSGLSEKIITSQMKTKTYILPTNATNLEEADSEEQETDICIICQDEYKNKENIGILRCGHEYHADCLRRWLLEKNVCPLCKSVALTPPGEKQ